MMDELWKKLLREEYRDSMDHVWGVVARASLADGQEGWRDMIFRLDLPPLLTTYHCG